MVDDPQSSINHCDRQSPVVNAISNRQPSMQSAIANRQCNQQSSILNP